MRRATYGTSEQVLDFPLQDRIGFEPYLECKTGGFSDEVLFRFQLTLIF